MTRMPQLRPRAPSSVAGGQLPDSRSQQSQQSQSEDLICSALCIYAHLPASDLPVQLSKGQKALCLAGMQAVLAS